MADMPPAKPPKSVGEAEAMRLPDNLMSHLDNLMSKGLRQPTAHLNT